MDLIGKSREQIEAAIRDKPREALIDMIYSLATCEPMFKPQEVATRRGMSKRAVMRLIKKGELRAHQTLRNAVRIPLSSIREYDRRTALFFVSNDKKNP
jgi:excisionase family DNA binding protein